MHATKYHHVNCQQIIVQIITTIFTPKVVFMFTTIIIIEAMILITEKRKGEVWVTRIFKLDASRMVCGLACVQLWGNSSNKYGLILGNTSNYCLDVGWAGWESPFRCDWLRLGVCGWALGSKRKAQISQRHRPVLLGSSSLTKTRLRSSWASWVWSY